MLEAQEKEFDITDLLEAIYALHGYDFRQYSRSSITRRIKHFMAQHGLKSTRQVQQQIRDDHTFLNLLVTEVSVTVTQMFRRPSVFFLLRDKILPALASKKSLKMWSAGCATGEEAYSLAIVLHELGLLERTRIYATDINSVSLETAANGIISLNKIPQYTSNYHLCGGREDFCNYYQVKPHNAIMESFLKKQILFTSHNLVHDQVFGEMDIIFCRNVMIYFTPELQKKVLQLFCNSLTSNGYLCIGSQESLPVTGIETQLDYIVGSEKIYQKSN